MTLRSIAREAKAIAKDMAKWLIVIAVMVFAATVFLFGHWL